MKRLLNWQVFLGLFLIVLSVTVYLIHYFIFRDVHHIFIYLIGDIAFVFFEVLLVMMILHQLLVYRDKKALFKKLNMVIGAFFSEAGIELLKIFSVFDAKSSEIAKRLVVTNQWSEKNFSNISNYLKKYRSDIDIRRNNLQDLKNFLVKKRQFLLNLLENPNLLEHESFTNLLWAVFHLTEELAHRKDLSSLLKTDSEHLANDIKRVEHLLISQWLAYMKHLKNDYPYLFSLAMRTNPFDASASVEVR